MACLPESPALLLPCFELPKASISFSPDRKKSRKSTLVFACLGNSKENQVFLDALFVEVPPMTGEPRKGFDRVFGIIVVPRHAVVARNVKSVSRFLSKRSLNVIADSLW